MWPPPARLREHLVTIWPPDLGAPGCVNRGTMQSAKVAHRTDAQCHGIHALRLQALHNRPDGVGLTVANDNQHIVNLCLKRRGRAGSDILIADRAGITQLVQADLFYGLTKIARFQIVREVHEHMHRLLRQIGDARVFQGLLDFVPCGGIVVDTDSKGRLVALECLAQFRRWFKRTCGHDDLCIARPPIGKRIGDDRPNLFSCVFDQSDARAGKEPDCL